LLVPKEIPWLCSDSDRSSSFEEGRKFYLVRSNALDFPCKLLQECSLCRRILCWRGISSNCSSFRFSLTFWIFYWPNSFFFGFFFNFD